MIKSELVSNLAATNPHLFAKDVEKAVNAILEEITAALVKRDRVELRGFGAFTVKTWSARPGRNPKTGTSISVPETLHPSFRTSKEMHKRLNGTAGNDLREPFHRVESKSGERA
jgi:integration host factor subunit beta